MYYSVHVSGKILFFSLATQIYKYSFSNVIEFLLCGILTIKSMELSIHCVCTERRVHYYAIKIP